MSVNVKIKQSSLFKKKLKLEDIIKLTDLSYGICDENYRLIENKMADHTLLYDKNKLARGIDISIDGTDIILILSLPTSSSEIILFYNSIEKICHHLKINYFIREEEKVNLKDKDNFIEYDRKASIGALEDLKEKLNQNTYERFEIFGICNPLSIGLKEIEEVGNNLDKLEKYLHHIQSLDVYYAAPKVFKVGNKLIGMYAISANIPSVVPLKPYIVLNQIQEIEEWYVILKEGQAIKYNDFIEHVDNQVYYDANHNIITLSEEDINTLLDKYNTKI